MESVRLSSEGVMDALLALARDLKEACAEAKSLLRALSDADKRFGSLHEERTGGKFCIR